MKSLIVLLYVIKSKTINYLLTFWAELLLDAGELLGDEHQQWVHLPHPALSTRNIETFRKYENMMQHLKIASSDQLSEIF